jgi:two-component system, response regulator / RNA-binding antiterminator
MLNILLVEHGSVSSILDNPLANEEWLIRKIQLNSQVTTHIQDFAPALLVFNVVRVSDDVIADLQKIDEHTPLPVIVFAQETSTEVTQQIISIEISAYIVAGYCPTRLPNIIQIAMARFKVRQAQRQALDDARTQLEDRKQIDRAKAILIKTQKFSEDEAYHTLRKLAMDRHVTLGEMARNVIAMAELLK